MLKAVSLWVGQILSYVTAVLHEFIPIDPLPAASLCAKVCPVRKRGPRERRPPRRTVWLQSADRVVAHPG